LLLKDIEELVEGSIKEVLIWLSEHNIHKVTEPNVSAEFTKFDLNPKIKITVIIYGEPK